MRWIAAAIALVAIVVLIVGLRATQHHAQSCPNGYFQKC